MSKQAIPLGNYLLDGRLELSNNRAERSIKPFVIGRKNWLFSNTPKGAEDAIIYSIMETAKKPFEYFQHLLEELPQIDRTDKEKLKRYLHIRMPCLLTARHRIKKETISVHGQCRTGKHKAVMPANTQLASVTAFFMPYVRMV